MATSDTPRARQLGSELKAARTAAGETLRSLASKLGVDHSLIAHYEAGRRAPGTDDLGRLLGALSVSGELQERLLDLARQAADPDWISPGIGKALGALVEYERAATAAVEANPTLLPGLLQTADYARSLMIAAKGAPDQVEQRVALRLARRDVLTRPGKPLAFTALIGEAALRFPPCGPEIMAPQLRFLASMAGLPNVTVRMIPFAARYTPAAEGPFVLITFDEDQRPVVQLEHYRSTATLSDAKDVRAYRDAVAEMMAVAISEADTVKLIAKLATETECAT